ncbi:MAG: tetratricopeptide repeat protein, partial [Armatimonadota bacterium]
FSTDMLRRSYKGIPAPPGAGLVKIADPRAVLRGWLVFLGLVVIVGAATWHLGLGRTLDEMRRQVVAVGYMQEAEAKANATPVQREAALAALERAVALAPERLQIADQAAQLFIGLRAYKEAIPWLRIAAPGSLLARVSLGESLLMTGKRAEGEQIMAEVLRAAYQARQQGQMPPQLFALILNNVGYIHVVAGTDLVESQQLIAAAVAVMPHEPAFIDSLGWAEYRLGDYLNAAFHLEQAVRLHLPNESAEVYYHLGAAYARLGRNREARQALERCLDLDRTFTEAARELDGLRQELPSPAVAQALPPVRQSEPQAGG